MKISSEIFHRMLLFGFSNSRHIKLPKKPLNTLTKIQADSKYVWMTDYHKKANIKSTPLSVENIYPMDSDFCLKTCLFFRKNNVTLLVVLVLLLTLNCTNASAEENNVEEELQKLILHLESRNEEELDSILERYNLLKLNLSKQDDEKIKSKLISLILKRAHRRLENKNHDDAYDDFKKVILLDDKNVEAYYQIGLIWKKNHFLKAALDNLNYGLEIIKEYETTQSNLDTKTAKKKMRKLEQKIKNEKISLLEQMNELQLNIKGSSGQPIGSESIRETKRVNKVMLELVKNEMCVSELQPAIQSNNKGDIENLIAQGCNPTKPSITILDDQILVKLPVEYAKSEKKWEIISLLLEKSVHYSSTENLKQIINGYAEHYVPYPDYDPHAIDKNKNLGIVLLSAKQLLTYPVEDIIKDSGTLDAYRKHLEQKTQSGMNTAAFLICRSFLVINMLFKFKHGVYDKQLSSLYKKEPYEQRKEIIEQALFEELHVTVDTFYSYKIAHSMWLKYQKTKREIKRLMWLHTSLNYLTQKKNMNIYIQAVTIQHFLVQY